MLLLELQRAQIKYRAARQYTHAARQAAGHTDGAAFQDRAYQVLYLTPLASLQHRSCSAKLASTSVSSLCVTHCGGR